jgi:hypothetical protein
MYLLEEVFEQVVKQVVKQGVVFWKIGLLV